MLDKSLIGKQYPDFSFEVEKGKIREFARAIGDNNPVYFDQGSAKKEGFRSSVAPPTFVILYYTTSRVAFGVLEELNVDPIRMLHAGQEYEYFKPIVAGDSITAKTKIADIFGKSGKSGAMDFIVLETTYVDRDGERVMLDRMILIIRN